MILCIWSFLIALIVCAVACLWAFYSHYFSLTLLFFINDFVIYLLNYIDRMKRKLAQENKENINSGQKKKQQKVLSLYWKKQGPKRVTLFLVLMKVTMFLKFSWVKKKKSEEQIIDDYIESFKAQYDSKLNNYFKILIQSILDVSSGIKKV